MGQRPQRMNCDSTGLRLMPDYDRGQRIKCPGIKSSEMNKLMYKLKKAQGTKTPGTVVLLMEVFWRTKDTDDYYNTFSCSRPHQNFPYSLC